MEYSRLAAEKSKQSISESTDQETYSDDSGESTSHFQPMSGKMPRFRDEMSLDQNMYSSTGQLQTMSAHQLIQDNNGNFSQIVGNSTDYFVVFLDPDSLLYYRVYLNNPSFIKIEPIHDEKLGTWARNRDKTILYKIRKLLMAENFSWNFNEAD